MLNRKENLTKALEDIIDILSSIIKLFFSWLLIFFIHKKEKIYLVGSSYGRKRSDNSITLYNYIESLGEEVYYIENSPKDKKSLKRGSLKSFIYYFRSNGVFYSHSFSDILPGMHRAGWLLKVFGGPQKVFIQHGVIGLKKIDKYIRSLKCSVDHFIVSTKFEKKLVESIGIPKEKVEILGLPRYDLLSKEVKNVERILVFLTWKEESLYVDKLNEILGVLKGLNFSLKVAVHDMIKADLTINKKYLTNDIGKEVREASILITDDSSVAWDFFYNDREVIFYKPEEEWYLEDIFLECRKVNSQKGLESHLKKLIDNNLKIEMPTKLFEYKDRHNSQRVFEILKSHK